MSKQLINITDITEFLYCPRKVYLRIVKNLRSPPNERMILGMLRHKVFDIFNKNEQALVTGIKEKLKDSEIKKLYALMMAGIIKEIFILNSNLAGKFGITELEFSNSIKQTLEPEIGLRVLAVQESLEKGFLGKELWQELKPKYLTEYKIVSEEMGLQGRVDRVKFDSEIIPVEIKTREKVYESDKLQLAGYSLLLEKEFGRSVNQGIVEFLGKQEKIDLTPELKNKVMEIAEKIRALSEENASFPSNFEKCRNCWFNEECNQ